MRKDESNTEMEVTTPKYVDQNKNRNDEEDEGVNDDEDYSDTCTITSDFYNFVEVNGITYHKDFPRKYPFPLPNCATEKARTDFLHECLKSMMGGKLYLAPVTAGNVLEIASGSGVWSQDLADSNLKCNVTGMDLSPNDLEEMSPNCTFFCGDAEDINQYPPGQFDLIFMRDALSINTGKAFWNRLREITVSGAWVEIQNHDYSFCRNSPADCGESAFYNWGKDMNRAMDQWRKGLGQWTTTEVSDVQRLEHDMAEAGFHNIVTKIIMVPIGSWPEVPEYREAGNSHSKALQIGIKGMSAYLLKKHGGYPDDQFDILMQRCFEELQDGIMYSHSKLCITYG